MEYCYAATVRIDLAGYMYHVIAHGTERKKIFLEKEDYEDFFSRFKTALNKTGRVELTRDFGLTCGEISRLIERGKDLHENLAVYK